MRFIREHLFFMILIGATLVGGAGGLVYYFLSDVDTKLAIRRKVSGGLSTLAKRDAKINQQTVKELNARIEAVRAAAKKDNQDSLLFNRKNLSVLQLKIGETQLMPAFPIDEVEYNNRGLYLVFIQTYTRTLDDMLSLDRTDLGRTTLATKDEIREEENKLRERWKEQAYNQAVKSMRLKKAQAGTVFIEDGALDRYFTTENRAPAGRLWEAQVNLWVTSEILQAIIATNQELFDERRAQGIGPAKPNVLASAVKRLVKINISESFAGVGGGFGAVQAASGFTERLTTGEYGVIRYQFSVVMPPRHVGRLLRNLMLQNYHTVVQIGMAEVERDRGEYYYGTEPVMAVDILAEMLLLLDWVRPLIPDEVKSRLPAGRPTT